jgi:hypothetical protein
MISSYDEIQPDGNRSLFGFFGGCPDRRIKTQVANDGKHRQ